MLSNYVVQATIEITAQTASQLGIESIEFRIKGLDYGKESLLCGLWLGGLIITKIHVNPTPHNGSQPPKNIMFKYHHKVIHFQLFDNT